MSTPNDILGKIGQKIGTEIKTLSTSVSNTYATKTDLDLKASQVSLGNVQTELTNLRAGTETFTSIVGGSAEFDSLNVKGETTIVNTQTIEVSDNIIELNKASDGSSVANTAGIEINRGSTTDNTDPNNPVTTVNPKPSLIWNATDNSWQFKVGTAKADLVTNTINVPNGNGVTINNVALGDYATFEAALTTALA